MLSILLGEALGSQPTLSRWENAKPSQRYEKVTVIAQTKTIGIVTLKNVG
jgi:hypothetical protein